MMVAILSDVRFATARTGFVLQMGVALGGWGLTMPEHLADKIEAVAARHGDRGEAVLQVMNADIVESSHVAKRRSVSGGRAYHAIPKCIRVVAMRLPDADMLGTTFRIIRPRIL